MVERVIRVTDDPADFHRQSGLVFLEILKEEAGQPDASDGMRRDWEIVARWLEHRSGSFTPVQSKRLEAAWTAYLSIGHAPSVALQKDFKMFAEQLAGTDKRDRPPAEIMDVFDRLLATDEEIRTKRAADWKQTEAEFRPLVDNLRGKPRPGWWRRQTPLVRNWLFGSLVWATLILVTALFFDPFGAGGWDRMNDEELVRLWLILLAPLGVGFTFYAYRKWVR